MRAVHLCLVTDALAENMRNVKGGGGGRGVGCPDPDLWVKREHAFVFYLSYVYYSLSAYASTLMYLTDSDTLSS